MFCSICWTHHSDELFNAFNLRYTLDKIKLDIIEFQCLTKNIFQKQQL